MYRELEEEVGLRAEAVELLGRTQAGFITDCHDSFVTPRAPYVSAKNRSGSYCV